LPIKAWNDAPPEPEIHKLVEEGKTSDIIRLLQTDVSQVKAKNSKGNTPYQLVQNSIKMINNSISEVKSSKKTSFTSGTNGQILTKKEAIEVLKKQITDRKRLSKFLKIVVKKMSGNKDKFNDFMAKAAEIENLGDFNRFVKEMSGFKNFKACMRSIQSHDVSSNPIEVISQKPPFSPDFRIFRGYKNL
jgi:septation ring formation regulator EzrA